MNPAAIHTSGVWFGSDDRLALGWLSRQAGRGSDTGIVILPPIAYPYWSTHRTLRVLAERLAAQGSLVLRVDYDGTGDSAGDQWEPQRLAAWRRTFGEAVALLRSLGVSRVAAVGVQLGGTLALIDAATHEIDSVVAWAPVISGRRFGRELRLLSQEVPVDDEPFGREGTRVMAGTVLTAETLAELAELRVAFEEPLAGLRALVVERTVEAAEAVAAPLRDASGQVDVHACTEAGELLETAPEFAVTPSALLDVITSWLGPGGSADRQIPDLSTANHSWRGGSVRERVVRLGSAGHVAIVAEPEGRVPAGPMIVFLNPGSESHVGPGRAWVELSRDLSLSGYRCARVDFLGWGESPDAERAPGRPYDQAGIADATEIAAALRERYGAPVVLFGLCAAAWIGLAAVLRPGIDAVIALNPQMYWKPGDPVDIDWIRIRERRAEEITSVARGARFGLWDALDRVGHRSRTGRWLDELAESSQPVELLFAEGDDGLTYLRQRHGRQLARLVASGALGVRELIGVDHPLHRTWVRPRVARELEAALARIAPALSDRVSPA